MLIKLNYNTTAKTPAQVWRVVADIIKNPSINSIANLRSREISASYAPDLLLGLVDSSSFIYRTNNVTPANVDCHIARPAVATSSAVPFEFIISQKVYDTTSNTKYYISLSTTGTAIGTANSQVSNTAGDFTSTQWPVTSSTTQTIAQGTTIGIGTPNIATSNAFPAMYSLSNAGVYCLWVYITDTCFMWAMNREQYTNAGFPINFSPANWNGPHIYSQYTRADLLNTDVNGIVPLVFTNHSSYFNYIIMKGPGEGLFSREEEATHGQVPTTNERVVNNASNGAYQTLSLQMLNCFGNTPGNYPQLNQIGSPNAWRIYYNAPYTAIGLGGTKWSDEGGLAGFTQGALTGALAHAAAGSLLAVSSHPTLGQGFRNATNYSTYWGLPSIAQYGSRWIAEDLESYYGYALLPIYHRWISAGWIGGNVTDKSGVYVFNGDYFAGDDIIVDGITYQILPFTMGRPATITTWLYAMGAESRLGLAVPKL